MANKTRQYEGDFRLWILDAVTGAKTAVNPDPTDAFGNTPVEASAAVPSYEAGDERTIVSKRRGRYGQVIYRDEDPGQANISLTLQQVPSSIIARMFQGAATASTVAAGSATNEPLTVVTLGEPIKLSKRSLSASPAPVVKNAGGTTTYVAGTDYVIDLRTGHITPLTDGDIAPGGITASFSYTGYEQIVVRGGVKPTEHFYVTGDLMNRSDKSDLMIEIYDATLSATGDLDLLATEFITLELSGAMVTPADKDAPYRVEQYTASA